MELDQTTEKPLEAELHLPHSWLLWQPDSLPHANDIIMRHPHANELSSNYMQIFTCLLASLKGVLVDRGLWESLLLHRGGRKRNGFESRSKMVSGACTPGSEMVPGAWAAGSEMVPGAWAPGSKVISLHIRIVPSVGLPCFPYLHSEGERPHRKEGKEQGNSNSAKKEQVQG